VRRIISITRINKTAFGDKAQKHTISSSTHTKNGMPVAMGFSSHADSDSLRKVSHFHVHPRCLRISATCTYRLLRRRQSLPGVSAAPTLQPIANNIREEFQLSADKGCCAIDGSKGSNWTREFELSFKISLESCKMKCIRLEQSCYGYEYSNTFLN